ncbi:hypothetical protein [Pareuzebyella sediminis]|uniref:hypothetical protein n=1 Tax=Pareuzebyella sediminis TaxID=2607998 RepID=UPI0011EFC12D|nr:hypothetical protein [Pareuzebyella sediminis]
MKFLSSLNSLLDVFPVLKKRADFRLIDIKNKTAKAKASLNDTKCNLEILPSGIMVVGKFAENDNIIPILKDEIESISLVRGREVIDTFYWSPMYIFLRLGIPKRIARYFQVYPYEYRISETQITIDCNELKLRLISRGSIFEKLVRTFKRKGYGEQLELTLKPSQDLLKYNL